MNSKEQNQAFEKFSKLKCGALFMSMGMGKTKVALDLAAKKISDKKAAKVLYIAPASLIQKGEIESERKKWNPELEINYITCEGIGSSDRIYLEARNICENYKTFCIVDESLKIKNIWAKRTKRIIELGTLAEYRLILNGTPLTKNIMDMWSQMEFLSPKILKMTYRQFKNTFCVYDLKGKLKGVPRRQVNVPYLISLLEPYIYQANLDIEPQKRFTTNYYCVNSLNYENKKNELFEKYFNDYDMDINFKAFSMALQKYYTSQKEHLEAIQEEIEKIDDKVIIFVKYLQNIPAGAKSITGSSKNRQQIIDDFKNGKFKILYITYGCGSFGLNLQFCKHIIFADHTWDYAQRLQAEGRIYRMDIQEDVWYHDIVCDNSGLEEMIFNNQGKKSHRLREIQDEINKAKGDKNAIKQIIKKL